MAEPGKSQKPKRNNSLKRKAATMEVPKDAETPPYRCELHFREKEFVVYVTLHKIPDRFIVLHVTNEEFCLHTLNYSKKYYLKFLFDDGTTKVDADRVQTEFDRDVLKCVFPIIETIDNATGKVVRKKVKKQPTIEESPSKSIPEVTVTNKNSTKNLVNSETKTQKSSESKKQSAEPKKQKASATEKPSKKEVSKDIQLSLIEELNLNVDNRNKRLANQAEAKVVHLEEKDEKKKLRKQKQLDLKEAALMEIVEKDSAERKKIDQFAKNKKAVLSTPTDKGVSKKKKVKSASKK